MSAPIVLGLPPDDVLFVRELLSDCAAQARREYKRSSRNTRLTSNALRYLSGWRAETAKRILAEIERQERACRKEMRENATCTAAAR